MENIISIFMVLFLFVAFSVITAFFAVKVSSCPSFTMHQSIACTHTQIPNNFFIFELFFFQTQKTLYVSIDSGMLLALIRSQHKGI